jgi:uncharacterized protein
MRVKSRIMDRTLERKLTTLRTSIRKLDGALVAFSGGVDSTFLMRVCREELGEKAVAVTTLSENYPRSELSVARRIAKIIGVRHLVINPAKIRGPRPPRRQGSGGNSNAYSAMKAVAMRMKLGNVLDGSHMDDAGERGRSFRAARAANVRSPLLESNLSKAEIRFLARELGLPNWDKPPSSGGRRKSAAKRTKPPGREGGANAGTRKTGAASSRGRKGANPAARRHVRSRQRKKIRKPS